MYLYPPAPACQGPPGCEGRLFNTQSSVPFNIPPAGEVSGIWCPAGQQSGDCWWYTVPPGWTIYLPPGPCSQLWVALKINQISMHVQYTQKSSKWCLKTSKSVQNEVPRGTWSHQNNENVEKVKSNENTSICNTFERLGHQNSREFPFKNHQKTWLQSKCDFELFKSEKIWKSDAEGSPMGDPKSIKNH